MKVTYNWLKDFVEIKIAPKALADKLTMAGLEVTSLEEKEGDSVFEIEVTSNRPDCLSIIGIAREVAAITGKKLKLPTTNDQRPTTRNGGIVSIKIENKKDCPFYTAKIIRDVKVCPSPDWLRKRLELIGCRSVNNIVDITNYILFTYGEPLHAFDLDKIISPLSGLPVSPLEIIIRRAKNGEDIITIDNARRILSEEVLVIASGSDKQTGKPIAIAGVMGSKDTEVVEGTKNILLEAAVFNPVIVRRGRQKLGIQSDSSYRFERGVDTQIVEGASGRAVDLIRKLAGGGCALAQRSGLPKAQRKNIKLGVSTVNKILGSKITVAEARKILNSLEFKARGGAKNTFQVGIPSHRPDVNSEIDLIEEVARIYGFGLIPQTLPQASPQVTSGQPRGLVSVIKNVLTGLGLNEVITYSLIDKDLLRHFTGQEVDEAIEILNPLSREQEILRPTLIPSLSLCVAHNLNQKQDYVNIFEVAKVFTKSSSGPREELYLGIALCGAKSLLLEEGSIKDDTGLLHLKGAIEVVLARLGIRAYNFQAMDNGRIAINVGRERAGFLGKLPQQILDSVDIKNKDVFAAELSLDKFLSDVELEKKFVRLPLYPGISRDISLIIKEEVAAGDILEAIKKQGEPLLREVRVIDYYKGKQIQPGFKGLTLSCFYRREERTLTETEITPLHSGICAFLKDRFGAQIR
ncbi:MAG: phenylalanine--tRNA ligase subunit beta [Candidatus Omnitrophica bacterium]|nr:phenylalanine--tRNA ligase subunit beta [Candidatus Omnitrophota bacterium]MDD5592464.1 phenylalanine--tRNA ligase subunit beta [Candidatus Omnitrophota bacterium]